MSCKMPWWAGSENPPPDKDKMIADLRAELSNEQEKVRKLELENSMSNCETVAWYEGHDAAVAGCCKRWEEALTLPIPALGVMNDPLESLYRATEALRAEIASLKEELAATQSVGLRYARENDDLTQQLAAAEAERDEWKRLSNSGLEREERITSKLDALLDEHTTLEGQLVRSQDHGRRLHKALLGIIKRPRAYEPLRIGQQIASLQTPWEDE